MSSSNALLDAMAPYDAPVLKTDEEHPFSGTIYFDEPMPESQPVAPAHVLPPASPVLKTDEEPPFSGTVYFDEPMPELQPVVAAHVPPPASPVLKTDEQPGRSWRRLF